MTMMSIKIIILSLPKQVVNIFDLGYLGYRKGFSRSTIIITDKKERNKSYTRRKRV